MTEKMGEPSWYYCFRKLTYQEKKKKKKQAHTGEHLQIERNS